MQNLDPPSVLYWIDFFLLITVVRGAPFTKTHPDKEEILVCNVVGSVEDSH